MSITIRNIRKQFGDREILKGIDFEFKTGAISMIIGGSGSGKTVLVKCMVGLLKPDTGNILYDTNDFLRMSHGQLRELRKQIGMLFQSAALFDSMNSTDNVAFPLRMFTNMTKKEIDNRVAFCLERVNLPHASKLYPSELSGGMKKRVGIARAIALNPKYLFCDEPNSGLDPKTAGVIDELIRDITLEYQMTTIVISHDIKSVITIGDHILFIYKGNKEWEGSKDDIKTCNNPVLLDFIESSGVNVHQVISG